MGDHSTGSQDIGWIREIVLNSPDPRALSEFWSELLGGSPVKWHDGWITLEPPPHRQRLSFQRADDAIAAAAVHFDVIVEDLQTAHEAVLAAGGAYIEERWSQRPGPHGEAIPWRVYADPDGHRFCLVVR